MHVLGWSQHIENDEYVRAVGVEFFAFQRDALDARIFELRGVWWCKQRQLSTVTGVDNRELFVWPILQLLKAIVRRHTRSVGQARSWWLVVGPFA